LLRHSFPGAQITLAGNLDYLRVVSRGYGDSVASLSTLPLHRLFVPGSLTEADGRFWRSYDRIASWMGANHEEFIRNLTDANPTTLIASWKPAPGEQRHVSQIFVDSIKPWVGETARAPVPRIHLDPEHRVSGETWLSQQGWMPGSHLIAVHPGAGSQAKRWPAERFQSLIHEMVEVLRAGVVLIAGPAEPGLARSIAEKRPGVYIAESLPLEAVAGTLALCQVFIGNDSGIAHLAAGLGLPSIVLFGATAPEHWAPRGGQVMILRNTRGCRPCETGSGQEHDCLSKVTVEEVWNAVDQMRQR
jgi:hypothetical protein